MRIGGILVINGHSVQCNSGLRCGCGVNLFEGIYCGGGIYCLFGLKGLKVKGCKKYSTSKRMSGTTGSPSVAGTGVPVHSHVITETF